MVPHIESLNDKVKEVALQILSFFFYCIMFQVRSSPGDKNLQFELHDLNKESPLPLLNFTTDSFEVKSKMVEKISGEIKRLESFKFDLGNPTL